MFDNVTEISDARYQLEAGYTQVANGILETLSTAKLTGAEFQIVLFIIRNTYGKKRAKSGVFSVQKIADEVGMTYKKASRILADLLRKNVLIRDGQRGAIGYQKYTEFWNLSSQKTGNSKPSEFPKNWELSSQKTGNSRDLLIIREIKEREKNARAREGSAALKKNTGKKQQRQPAKKHYNSGDVAAMVWANLLDDVDA